MGRGLTGRDGKGEALKVLSLVVLEYVLFVVPEGQAARLEGFTGGANGIADKDDLGEHVPYNARERKGQKAKGRTPKECGPNREGEVLAHGEKILVRGRAEMFLS